MTEPIRRRWSNWRADRRGHAHRLPAHSELRDMPEDSLFKRVGSILDQLRPVVQADGGDIELIGVDEEGVVTVRLHGACVGCPSSAMTLTMGIERNLKNQIPEVTRVVCA